MSRGLAALLLALALLTGACADNDGTEDTVGETDTSAEEFTLTGTVIDAKADVEPEGGFPEEQEDGFGGIAVRPDDEDDATNLDDCETEQDAYVTYYTEETDLGDLDDEEGFPDSLEGQRVTVQGTIEQPADDSEADTDTDVDADAEVETTDDGAEVDAEVTTTDDPEETDAAGDAAGCVLTLTDVELATVADADDEDADSDTGTGGAGTDDGEGTPGPSGSPAVTTEPGSTPGLPEGVEDTDPIFEGTPNPDECEGAKACREDE